MLIPFAKVVKVIYSLKQQTFFFYLDVMPKCQVNKKKKEKIPERIAQNDRSVSNSQQADY